MSKRDSASKPPEKKSSSKGSSSGGSRLDRAGSEIKDKRKSFDSFTEIPPQLSTVRKKTAKKRKEGDEKIELDPDKLASAEERPKLAELLLRFYEVNGKEKEFLKWSLTTEVKNTKRPEELLREGTMGAHFMFYHFFGDTGMRYLQTFILPLVNEICSNSVNAPLYVDEMQISQATATANLNLILDAISKFLRNIYDATLLCPLLIRYGLQHLSNVVKTAYTETDTDRITVSVLMLRFVCPAIISPHKYGLLDEPPLNNSGPGLLLAAKILQSVANGVPWAESDLRYVRPVNKFIKKQIPFMTRFMEKLWNAEEIDKGFRTLEASDVNAATDEDIQEAIESLCSYLEMKDTYFEFEGQTDQLKQFKDHENWQPVKCKVDHVSLLTMRHGGVQMFMSRSTIKAPMEVVFETLHDYKGSEAFWRMCFPSILSIERIETVNDTHSDYRMVSKLPFPFSTREWVTARHDYLGRHECLLLEFSVDKDKPDLTRGGNVRATIDASGWFLTETSDGLATLIQQVTKADYGSRLPKWIMERIGQEQAKGLAIMKKYFEKVVAAEAIRFFRGYPVQVQPRQERQEEKVDA